MHFTHASHAAGSKSTKLAVVIVFHVILGIALVKTMNVRLLNLPAVQPPVELVPRCRNRRFRRRRPRRRCGQSIRPCSWCRCRKCRYRRR